MYMYTYTYRAFSPTSRRGACAPRPCYARTPLLTRSVPGGEAEGHCEPGRGNVRGAEEGHLETDRHASNKIDHEDAKMVSPASRSRAPARLRVNPCGVR